MKDRNGKEVVAGDMVQIRDTNTERRVVEPPFADDVWVYSSEMSGGKTHFSPSEVTKVENPLDRVGTKIKVGSRVWHINDKCCETVLEVDSRYNTVLVAGSGLYKKVWAYENVVVLG